MQTPADAWLRVEIERGGKLPRSRRSIEAASHLKTLPFSDLQPIVLLVTIDGKAGRAKLGVCRKLPDIMFSTLVRTPRALVG
jgi:hypothetical protein